MTQPHPHTAGTGEVVALVRPVAKPVFRLLPGEPLASGIPRIVVEQLTNVVALLRREPDRDVAIHETRKAMKRNRAVLRLVRDTLGYFRYREENVVLRDSSRRVAAVRDSAVIANLARTVLDDEPHLLSPVAAHHLVATLQGRHDELREAVEADPQLTIDLLTTLLCARARYAGWPVTEAEADPRRPDVCPLPESFETIAGGLHRTYRRGLATMETARRNPTPEHLHLWRKRVKYLRHQHEVLTDLWPDVVGGAARGLDHLGEVLGTDHDLVVLADLLTTDLDLVADPRRRARLLQAMTRRRTALQAEAFALGERLYAETPDAFVRRFAGIWATARG